MVELDSIDLEPRHLKKIRSIFARHLPYKKVWAYGSRVKWTASNTSDLDCVVFGATDSEIANAREAFDESDIPFEVQLLNWNTIPDDFKENIKEGYFILQNKWDWSEKRLGNIITLQRGHDLSKHNMLDGNIPVVGSNGIIGYHNAATTKAIGVTMGRSENLGNTYLHRTDFWAHNTTLYVKDFKDNDKIFIYYLLKNIDFKSFNVGSAVPTLNRNHVHHLKISLPTLPEQKAIASVLSSIDDKIDLLHRQNNTLESIAETIFRKWFIEEADDSWEKKSLKKIANYLNGLACQKYPPKNDFDKLPVLKIKDLKNGLSKDSDWSTSDVEKEYIVQKGDIIFSWSGSLLVKIWDGETCVLNQHLFKVTSDQYHKWFIYLWTNYHLAKFIAIAESKATTMGHIKKTDLDDAIIILPSDTELKHMDKIMIPIIDKIIVNNTQIKTLESLRDTLLPKLISGDIRVEYEEVS